MDFQLIFIQVPFYKFHLQKCWTDLFLRSMSVDHSLPPVDSIELGKKFE